MANFNPANYVDVQERINLFWVEHPDGAIVTDLMSSPDDFDRCRYKAAIYKHRDDARPSGTGWAFELAGGGGANRTSHEENCETSAIGRALANLAYAKTRDDRPSRQEMSKVNKAEAGEIATPPQAHRTQAAPKAPQALQQRAAASQRPQAQPAPSDAPQEPPASPGAIASLHGKAGKIGIDHNGIHALVVHRFGLVSTNQITGKQVYELDQLLKNPDAARQAVGEALAATTSATTAERDAETQSMIDGFNSRHPQQFSN